MNMLLHRHEGIELRRRFPTAGNVIVDGAEHHRCADVSYTLLEVATRKPVHCVDRIIEIELRIL